jgi:hypothetical protein
MREIVSLYVPSEEEIYSRILSQALILVRNQFPNNDESKYSTLSSRLIQDILNESSNLYEVEEKLQGAIRYLYSVKI